MNRNTEITAVQPPIPTEWKLSEPVDGTRYLCGGEIIAWEGERQPVWSPIPIQAEAASRSVLIGYTALCTGEQSREILEAAASAYDHGRGYWPTMTVAGRIAHVEDFVRRMQQVRLAVIRLIMWEIGKSWSDSEKEFDRTVKYIIDTIAEVKELDRSSSRFTVEQGFIGKIRRSSLGVVLSMGPYNYPLNETFTTLIPALIMGNTVIFKPPRIGMLCYQPLLEAFRDSFPPGVVNMVAGEGPVVIPPLLQSGRIDVLGFIGTSRVANELKKLHPRPHRLRCILGLEAKNPAIVLSDADLEVAVRECVLGSLSLNGQRCTAIKMIFLHSALVEDFMSQFVSTVESLRLGLPWEDGVQITPLTEPGKPEALRAMIADAESKGARIMNRRGGEYSGNLFHPAVLFPVNPEMQIYQVEQFGPVVPVIPFEQIGEPIDYIINSNFGQQVSIFGSDPEAISRLIDPLINQVARINLNSLCQRDPDTFPFTGRKDSAEGTLSVSDALRVFSIRTLVAAKSNPANQKIITDIVSRRLSGFLSTDYIF